MTEVRRRVGADASSEDRAVSATKSSFDIPSGFPQYPPATGKKRMRRSADVRM